MFLTYKYNGMKKFFSSFSFSYWKKFFSSKFKKFTWFEPEDEFFGLMVGIENEPHVEAKNFKEVEEKVEQHMAEITP